MQSEREVRPTRFGISNYARWIEYSISASLTVILITMICGVVDLAAILAVFCINACMILLGKEVYIILSLTAKALLTWQVCGAVLTGAVN